MQIQTQSDKPPSYTQFEGEQSEAESSTEEKSLFFKDFEKSFEDNYKISEEFFEEQNLCENAAKLYRELISLDNSIDSNQILFEHEDNKRDIQQILRDLENKLSTLQNFNKKKEELKKDFEERKQTNLKKEARILARRPTLEGQQLMSSFIQKFKKKAEHQIKNDLRDIIWEPQNLFEKVQNLFQGCIEPIYILIVGFSCLYAPSFVSFAYYLTCIQHHIFMLYNIKVRFLNGLKVQAFVFLVLLIFIILKIVYLRDLYRDLEENANKGLTIQVKRNTKSLFNDDLRFYNSFGFSLSYDSKLCSVNFDECYYEVDILQSFTFERSMLQLNVLFCIYLWLAHLKIQNLFQMQAYKIKHLKKLEAYFNKKNDEDESDLDLSEDSQGEDNDQNNQSVKTNAVTFGVEERQKDKEKLIKYLRLKKEVNKNYVESKYFFSWKHTFYVVGVLSQLIGSLIRKNILELPFIFLILICLAFYFARKKYRRQYWIYQLYLVKLIQRINIFKQLSFIILCLEYVQSYLSSEHSTVKQAIQITFGQDKFVSFEKLFKSEGSTLTIVGFLLVTFDLFLMHGFFLCLSLEIRDKVGVDLTFFEQFKHQIDCIQQRIEDDAKLNEEITNFKSLVQLAPEKNKQNTQPNSKKEEFYDNRERKAKRLVNNDNSFETDIFVTLFSRIFMFILAYMYHSAIGFLCLIWVLISFILPSKVYKLISIFVTLPILCIQFTLIYGIRTQVLRETWFFQTFGAYYDWQMKNEWLEYIFMSIVILCYMCMVTLHFDKLGEEQPKGQLLIFFQKKIANRNSSEGWKLVFLASKYLYIAVLAWLFFQSFMQNFANLLAMEYLFFFLLYTSSSWLYRNTSFLIIWFISIDILGQYYCSLIWPCFKDRPTLVNTFYWLDFFPQKNNPYIQSDTQTQFEKFKSESLLTQKNPFNIKLGQDLYFRLDANYQNWFTLLMVVLCRYLNSMYEDKKSRNKVVDLTEETQFQFQDKNPKISCFINNFEKYFFTVLNHLLTYSLIVWQVFFLETNLITWVFFFLNVLSLAFQLRNNKTQESHQRVQKAFGYIKVYSAIIIILHIAFVLLLGDLPKTQEYHKDKLNYKFMKAYPEYYQYLNIIGLRSIVYSNVDYDFPDKEQRDHAMKVTTMKLSFYVGAFLIATYCENFYFTQSKETEAEEKFVENDYKKLFEYKISTDSKEKKDQENEDKYESDQEGEKQFTKIYTKSKSYNMTDFQKFYEKQTFNTPYYVYTLVDYWNYFDMIAQYGHIVNNFIVFYLALFRSLSFYFFVNLFFILMFYAIASQRIKYDSNKIRQSSGLQSQCDLNMAQIITKKYKTQAFYEFLNLRKKIWVLQCFTFLIVISLGYPSSLLKNLYKIKEIQREESISINEKGELQKSIDTLKNLIFNLIFLGVYKDESPQFKFNFYIDFIFVIIGLSFENQCINWLENRFGCNYFRFQKFIELDMRNQALQNSWGNMIPEYNIEKYRKHYFKEDFEELKIKFTHSTHSDFIKLKRDQLQNKALNKKATSKVINDVSQIVKDNNQMKQIKLGEFLPTTNYDIQNLTHTFGDFIPQKKAISIREMIRFSLQLDCEAPEIVKDFQTKNLLKEKNVDYESIPILREYKIKQLRNFLQQNIETKYKISLAKGFKMVAENFIMMLMMISLVLKCNLFSLAYLLLVLRYSTVDSKTDFMIRMVFYQAICLLTNYFLILLNLNPKISPRPFPSPFKEFPGDWIGENDKPKHFTPFFFNFQYIRHNLSNGVMFGLGIDKTQFYSLFIDLINVFIISTYVIHFKNPILATSMKKVFWEFPTPFKEKKSKDEQTSYDQQVDSDRDNEKNDQKEDWDRLEDLVKKQVLFLRNPLPLNNVFNPDKRNNKFQDVKLPSSWTNEIPTNQYNFLVECKLKCDTDKNEILKTYTDISSQEVWSQENIKAKKRELKFNSGVYRIVKKGSISIYLFFHVFTLFVVLFMGVLRQSLLSLGYIFILMPHLSKASDVLKQRQGNLENQLEKVKKEKKIEQTKYEVLFYDSISQKFKKNHPGKFNPAKVIGHANMQKVSYLLFSEKLDIEILEKEEIKRIISHDKNFKAYNEDILALKAKEDALKARLKIETEKESWSTHSNLFYLILIHACHQFQQKKQDKVEKDIWEMYEQKQNKVQEIKREISANKQREIRAGEYVPGKKTSGWSLIPVLQNLLLGYALLDLILSIIYQLPIIQDNEIFKIIGLKKIFTFDHHTEQSSEVLTFKKYLDPEIESLIVFNQINCGMLTFNCLIVAIIFLQSNIFESPGYFKFISQENGSMDLFIKLSDLKAKLLTYISNNQKLNTVQQNQKWREKILNVVETIKKKVEKLRKIEKKNFELNEKIQNSDIIDAREQQLEQKEENLIENEEQYFLLRKKNKVEALCEDDLNGSHDFSGSEEVKRLSDQEFKEKINKLAKAFVKDKMKKLGCCASYYQWFNQRFCSPLILNDDEDELKDLKQNLAQGKIQLLTSLEKTFKSEATDFIYNYYSTSEKKRTFELELEKYKGLYSDYEVSDIDQKIRVEDMPLMSEFFSGYSLYIRFFETFSLMLISQSQNLIFISMILSMYVNAGIVSLFYPFAVFGYGLLEEKRPDKAFWKIVLTYSIFLLFAKILINLEIIQEYVFKNEHYLKITKDLPLEFLATNDGVSQFVFLLPEAMIVCFIMLNQIKLKMLGLDYQSENEIETIHDAIIRVEAKGNEDKINKKREEELNDNMYVFFDSVQEQKQNQLDEINKEKQTIITKLQELTEKQLKGKLNEKTKEQFVEDQLNKKFGYKHLKDEQDTVFYNICDDVRATSTKFDLDSAGVHSFTDDLIEWNCIQKVLDSDSLTYVEGFRKVNQSKFMSKEEFKEHKLKKDNWEVMSADDFDVYEEDQLDYLSKRKEQKIFGWMDKQEYFKRLFPPVQIQKPGEDYLGSITFSLIFILYYLFAYFDKFTFSQDSLGYMQDEISFFPQEFIIVACFVIFVLLFERIVNRTNTIKKVTNLLDVKEEGNNQTHKHHTHHHKHNGHEIDDDQLDNTFSKKDFKTIEDKDSQYKVSYQQKWKYYLHFMMLVLGHFYIFFIIPIKSNISLYGIPFCDQERKELYGCFNFHDNTYLRFLYILLVLYLWFSSKQISKGFSMKRKASLLLEGYWWLPRLCTDIVTGIPFFAEIRCLIDFMSSKTSLDYSQFVQLFIYQKRFYACAVGNRGYHFRKIGASQTFCDRFLCGHLVSLLFVILIIGPLILFSQFSPLLGNNRVEVINVNVHYDVQSLLSSKEGQLKQVTSKNYSTLQDLNIDDDSDYKVIQHQMMYKIYENQNAYQRDFVRNSDNFINKSNPETLNFQDDSAQVIELRQYSDKEWESSFENRQQLKIDMQRISEDAFISDIMNFSLALDFEFKRKQPETALVASIQQKKVLNVTNYFDCMTAKELKNVSKIDCNEDDKSQQSVIFSQVYIPGISLGQTSKGKELNTLTERIEDQKFDIKLTLSCNGQQPYWSIEGNLTVNNLIKNLNLVPNSDKEIEQIVQEVLLVKNTDTCELMNFNKTRRCELQKLRNQTLDFTDAECYPNATDEDKAKKEVLNPGFVWTRIKLAVFSLQVTTSFLAAYTVLTFYLLILFTISGILRMIFVTDYWLAKFVESTHVMPLIKLCEACYIYRHEEDLVKEEETYRVLQEAIRSDALFKALSGSSLKGENDPQYDDLDKDQKKKLLQLEKLEQKGFEVSNLKKKILQNKNQAQDELEDLTQDRELKQ